MQSYTVKVPANWFEAITVLPAYGRDYKSAKAALSDWFAGKDFRDAMTGQYLSIRDDPPGGVRIRYNKLSRIVESK